MRKITLLFTLMLSIFILNSCNENDDTLNENEKSINLKFISQNKPNNEVNVLTSYTLNNNDILLNSKLLKKINNVRNQETNKIGSFFYYEEFSNISLQNRTTGSVKNGYFFDFGIGCFVWGTMYIDDHDNTLFIPCGIVNCGMMDRCLDDGTGGQWAKTQN
ncbi:hypothetical protein [Empedobacter sp.]|uniref:hypothetical protein n=1 Tax=Empedobacter sp. TaxID=1927715 RepID=UPI0028A7F020|nr:hypothetical protein [Empedobacter sp.]